MCGTNKFNYMKLSIIVPVYNVEKYIVKCVGSLLLQDYDDYEIVVVDDGTPDLSIKVLKESIQSDKITIIHQENRGLSAARNSGLKIARGDYIWFFDSDDWVDKNCLGDIAAHLSDCDVLYFDSHYNDTDDTTSIVSGNIRKTTGKELSLCAISYPAQYYIYRHEFLIAKNLTFEEGLIHEDTMFTPIALYLANYSVCYKKPVYHQYARNGSITHTINPKRCYDLMTIVKRHMEFINLNVSIEDRLAWGNHISNSVNAMMALSLQCDKEVRKDVGIFIKMHQGVTEYLMHSRKYPSRLLGYALKYLPFEPMPIYNLLFKLRYKK